MTTVFASSPNFPWQQSTRQQGWYSSGTLRKQFPNLTVQIILSPSSWREREGTVSRVQERAEKPASIHEQWRQQPDLWVRSLSPLSSREWAKKGEIFLRAQKIAITVRILKRRGARLHLLCSWGSKPCLRYSEVWKLSSQSSTDVPALLPSAMLTR